MLLTSGACVAGKGRRGQHRRLRAEEQRATPIIAVDYCIMGEPGADGEGKGSYNGRRNRDVGRYLGNESRAFGTNSDGKGKSWRRGKARGKGTPLSGNLAAGRQGWTTSGNMLEKAICWIVILEEVAYIDYIFYINEISFLFSIFIIRIVGTEEFHTICFFDLTASMEDDRGHSTFVVFIRAIDIEEF